jgi:uncharacterized protein
MKKFDQLVLMLLILGGFIWGIWGLFEVNLIYYVFGTEWINRVIYILFGVSSVYAAVSWVMRKSFCSCKKK